MFAFSQVEPNRTGHLAKWDIPVNRWLDVRFGEGEEFSALEQSSRMGGDLLGDAQDYFLSAIGFKQEIDVERANREYGIPGHLEFSGPVPIREAMRLNARKKKELELAELINSADHSFPSWKSVAGAGAMIAGNISNPLDFALMFLPVVGSSAKAKAAATAGHGIFRQSLARGLITEESLAMLTRFPKFGASVIDASVGNAIAEIPVFIQKQRDRADYDLGDSALNVAAGGVAGGVLHLGFRGIGKVWDRMTPEIKEQMFRHEVDMRLKSEASDVTPIALMDEAAIAAKVDNDLRKEAILAVESEMAIEGGVAARRGGEMERSFDVIDAIEGHYGGKISLENARGLKEDVKATGAGRKLFGGEGGTLDDVLSALHSEGLFTRIETDEQLLEAILKAGEARKGYRAQVAAERDPAATRQVMENSKANERERRIREYIESRKPERLAAARMAELQQQQAQGKILTQEQIEEFTLASDESSLRVAEEDAANIEANLNGQLDAKLKDESLTPEEREGLQAELDAELKQIEESIVDETKAVEQAKNCLLGNG